MPGSSNEDAEDEREEAQPEQRTTLTGKILRATWLDELPQLFNVLKGDMSLVGPRPERSSYVQLFEQRIYRYGDRHRVKAGITGWAQVHGLRGKTSLADRVEWDNYYIENASLWLDLKILGMTIRSAFRPSAHRDSTEPLRSPRWTAKARGSATSLDGRAEIRPRERDHVREDLVERPLRRPADCGADLLDRRNAVERVLDPEPVDPVVRNGDELRG